MAKREILNIDTNPAHYNLGQGYQTYQFDSRKVALAPNSFNIRVPLQKTYNGIRKIYLKSIEFPVCFPCVRETSNLNTIVIADSANIHLYTIILADKNYTNIATLLTDLNAMALSTFPTYNLIVSLNSSGFVQITSTNTSIFTGNIIIKPTNLSKLLGFRDGLDVLTTRSTAAVVAYRLSGDDYLNIYLPQFSSISSSTMGMCSFKVPLNTTNAIIYFKESADNILIANPTLRFSLLEVVIYDKWGYSLNSNGLDWSFSLILEY